MADIAVTNTFSPVLWFEIPGGAFGGAAQLQIWPISLQSLRGGQAKIGGIFVDRTPEQILLSPPWQFKTSTQKSKEEFPLNFTVKGVIDRTVYASSESGQVVVTAPCLWRATYDTSFKSFACFGTLIVKDTIISYTSNLDNSADNASGCPVINYVGNVSTVTSDTTPDNSGTLYSCVCINITQVGATNTPGYDYKVKSTVCMNFLSTSTGGLFVYVATATTDVGKCYKAGDPTPYVSTGLSAQGSTKADCSGGSAGIIPADDVCLGQFDPSPKPPIWSCIKPSYNERITHRVWTQDMGAMATLVLGQQTSYQDKITYGFLNIPLPPNTPIAPEGESWWQKYGKIVLGVTISMFILLLILAYAISRLIRYREKYLVEKRDAAALREEAQELDEKHGGLGVYDEEVEMIANPLVVQMQELQKQLEQTNASLSTQEELDATQMAAMDKERQRILEEIKRVKDAIAAQKKSAPTAAYDAPQTNPTSTAPSGTTSAQPATSERQEFVQSAPPRRKKNEF